MNKIMIAGGVFFVIVAIVVGVFIYLQFKDRLRSTNNSLPSIDELEREEQLRRMRNNREKYGFEEKDEEELSIERIGFSDEVEIDVSKYLDTGTSTSIADDFRGVINARGEVGIAVPVVIKSEISLPSIDDADVEVTIIDEPIEETEELTEIEAHETDSESESDVDAQDAANGSISAEDGSSETDDNNAHDDNTIEPAAEPEGSKAKGFSLPTID